MKGSNHLGVAGTNDADMALSDNIVRRNHGCIAGDIDKLMPQAFVSLSVIPKLRLTAQCVFDEEQQRYLSCFENCVSCIHLHGVPIIAMTANAFEEDRKKPSTWA